MEDKPKKLNKKAQLSMMKLVGTALLILLFAVSMVNFGFILSKDNNSSHAITNDESLQSLNNSFTSRLNTASDTLNATKEGFFSDVPVLSTIEATITAIFGVIPSFITQITASFGLIFSFIRTQLGIPPIVLQMATAFIVVMGILLAWRVYKAGQ